MLLQTCEGERIPTLSQELQTFINNKGVDWVARAAAEVLNRIKKADVDKEEWLRQLREGNRFTSDDCELLKAICAYEAAHAQGIEIQSGELRPLAERAGCDVG